MIDFGSRYMSVTYVGLGTYAQWSFTAAPVVIGTISSYRTLTGMGG